MLKLFLTLLILLLVWPISSSIANNPTEPAGCLGGYPIREAVKKFLSRNLEPGFVVEIREQDVLGNIYLLFVNRLEMEGLFFQEGEEFFVCEITSAIEFDREGKLIVLWNPNQKQS